MSASKLAAQCLGSPVNTVLVTCHEGNSLVGHAFATTWDYEGGNCLGTFINHHLTDPGSGTVCWITQLVVSSDHRQRGIATVLLGCLKGPNHTAFGLVSSHPAACLALCKIASAFYHI